MEEMVDITGATCRTWVSIKVPYSFCFQLITGAALHNSVTSSFPFISFDSICKRYSGYFPIFCILMWRCILSNRQRHCSNLNVIPVFMWEISCVVGLPLLMNILQCSDVVAVSLLESHSHRGSLAERNYRFKYWPQQKTLKISFQIKSTRIPDANNRPVFCRIDKAFPAQWPVLVCWCVGRAEEVDVILQHSEGGVDSALLYAKTISKYMKDLMCYVEKRTSLG